jgi:hypothetical protein
MTATPQIRMILDDGYADVYSFATLYDYLVEREFPAEFSLAYMKCNTSTNLVEKFVSLVKNPNLKLEECSAFNKLDKKDIILSSYSDVGCRTYTRANLFIDLSILKNCVKPLIEDERNSLREKHNISLEEKVLVIGFPGTIRDSGCEEKIMQMLPYLSSIANVYLIGNSENFIYLDRLHSGPVNVVSKQGVLRDYYAMADVALIDKNVFPRASTLHNFIEATAGGPLFLVPPIDVSKRQYGYKQLIEREAIREVREYDLVAAVEQYFKAPEGEKIREQRRQHLEESRQLYLPDLERLLKRILKISNEPFQSNLEFDSILLSQNMFKVFHPETYWDTHENRDGCLSLNELPDLGEVRK